MTLSFVMIRRVITSISCVYLYSDTATTVAKHHIKPTEKDLVTFFWTMSSALDQKRRWLTANTSAGAPTTAVTTRMWELNAMPPRHPQSV